MCGDLLGGSGSSPKLLLILEGGGQKTIQNSGLERGPLRQAGLKRKVEKGTEGSVGSKAKKGRW